MMGILVHSNQQDAYLIQERSYEVGKGMGGVVD